MLGNIKNSLGERLTYCRSSLCLTRKALSKAWEGASIPTLVRWELDKVKIPKKKLVSLVSFFQQTGLFVTEEWLNEAIGEPPVLLKNDIFDNLDFDGITQEKFLDINRKVKHFIFGQVKNNLMTPFIKYGDYVGGVSFRDQQELTFMQGELIFLRKKMTGLVVGLIKEIGNLISIQSLSKKTESIDNMQVEAIGKIVWIARRP